MRLRKSALERREEIVGAALALIDRGGPSAATTTAIAEIVGVSQAAIFRHFPKREEILLAVVDWIAGHVAPRLRAAADTADTPLGRLNAVLDVQLRIVRDTPAMPALLFSRELHKDNERLRSAVYGHIGRIHDLLAEILRAGTVSGVFRAGLDVDRAAFMIIGLLQGLVVRWSLTGRRLDLLEEGHAMFEMLLNGLLAGKGEPR
ncbi:TetR/AcrR family transcriptional regulator [Telmatospirillum siberiense]|uniref:TetR/AcrR family transcriptional regulator n=1 Tax=Telmatospirillum siberiense TaxID=382514 RepID=A0A2N3PRV8_9PROT|nr:TetR/AcrR family transcriptional regulator [Telmatospirillum siberiense]PKU23137.1 TetR/AcrR family transcriptional regulator [Telmatospirillum siberiense]